MYACVILIVVVVYDPFVVRHFGILVDESRNAVFLLVDRLSRRVCNGIPALVALSSSRRSPIPLKFNHLYGQQIVDAPGEFHLVRGDILQFRNRALVFHKLSFAIQSLRKTISHGLVKVFKDGIDGEGPREPSLNPKYILEWDGLFVGLVHGVGGLLFQPIDGSDTRHETVANIHEHTRSEEESSDTKHGHDSDKVDNNRMVGTVFVGTKKVVPSKDRQSVGCASPRVDQKQQKMLEIVSPNAIVHPRTMVVHSADTPIADTAMVGHGRFEGLTLPAHGV
mmetsp:Transcript_1292/g.2960  ORF Transcript_1292/g.2960 Transcript_1292/m.2960 type:complete len:280 (+) Transcript_1292:145-984(+)